MNTTQIHAAHRAYDRDEIYRRRPPITLSQRPTFPSEAYQVYRAFGSEMCNDGDQTPSFADAFDTFLKAHEAKTHPQVVLMSFDVAGARFESASDVTEEFEAALERHYNAIAAE